MAEEEVVEEQTEIHKKPGKGSSVGKLVLIILLTLGSSAGGVLSGVLIMRTMRVQAEVQKQQPREEKFEEQNLAETRKKTRMDHSL